YSFDLEDILLNVSDNGAPLPRDATDDNYNLFDPFPPGHTGEHGDTEYYDSAGAVLLPIDRFRRFVTPMDINGTGDINTFGTQNAAGNNFGPDLLGRVEYTSYYRPPGSPGVLSIFPTINGYTPPANNGGSVLGQVYYPATAANPGNAPPFYTA